MTAAALWKPSCDFYPRIHSQLKLSSVIITPNHKVSRSVVSLEWLQHPPGAVYQYPQAFYIPCIYGQSARYTIIIVVASSSSKSGLRWGPSIKKLQFMAVQARFAKLQFPPPAPSRAPEQPEQLDPLLDGPDVWR